MAKITINDLLEAGCHYGHQTRRWNPRMKDYVYTVKSGISIIDLTKTMRQIADACNFLQRVVADGGDVLFVGTKPQLRETIKELAERTGMFSVTERWLGGTLTNNVTIRKSIAKMNEIDGILGSDSVNGMAWVRQKKCKTKLPRTPETEELFQYIERAENWLKTNTWSTKILKWDTDNWGEIPADFNRKH